MSVPIKVAPPLSLVSDSLSALGLRSDTLYYGLSFQETQAQLSGFVNKLRHNKGTMDLDIACLLYDNACNMVDLVWFKSLRDHSEAVRHQGDSINGKDRGEQAVYPGPVDLEQINIQLSKLPAHISHIALVLSSYHGQPINQIQAGRLHLGDDEGNIAFELDLTALTDDCSALWVAHLRREVGDWHLTVQHLPVESNNIPKIASFVSDELARSLPLSTGGVVF